MEKTTVYLTTEQKRALARAARVEGRSEAELIREGIETVTARHRVAEPTLPLSALHRHLTELDQQQQATQQQALREARSKKFLEIKRKTVTE